MREELRCRKARVAHVDTHIAGLLRRCREEISLQHIRIDREHRRDQREQQNQEAEQLFAKAAEDARRNEQREQNNGRIDQLAGAEERRECAECDEFPRAYFFRPVSELKDQRRKEKYRSD